MVQLREAKNAPRCNKLAYGRRFTGLALGVLSHSSKLFECFRAALWYINRAQPTREVHNAIWRRIASIAISYAL
jgi:hypothetical protein